MNKQKKFVRVEWKRNLFTEVPPDEKRYLFSEISNELFENLDDRLEIKPDGTIGEKRDYNDGIYPVFITEESEEPAGTPVYQELPVMAQNVITVTPNFASSNFSLQLVGVKEIIEESEGKERSIILYTFLVQMQGAEFTREVKVSELERMDWVREVTKGRAYFSERTDSRDFPKYVHEVIERDISMVKKLTIYGLSGWKKINQKIRYVCSKGIIGEPYSGVSAALDMKFETLAGMDKDESIRHFLGMQAICRKEEKTRMLMIFVNMAVMTTLFELVGYPIKTLLGVLGTTNTMKTSVAMVFSKIFNAQETTSPEVTFTSTRAGIETYVAKYADAILLVDDFMPGDDKAKQAELNAKLELLCRLYGDRTSKKRMTVFSDKKNVEFPVRGCCMITGELMTGVQSSRTRIVCINLRKSDINKDVLSFYQTNPLILPTYLEGFLEYVSRNAEWIMQMMKERMQEYRRSLRFKIERFNEAAAHFLVTLDVMAAYWKEILFSINVDDMIEEWRRSVVKVFEENDRELATTDDGTVILQALEEALYDNSSLVKPVDAIHKNDNAIAYMDKDFIYIQQKKLYVITKKFCQKYDIKKYMTQDMIAQKLEEKDILECIKNTKGHTERSRKLKQGQGNTKRYLYIKRGKMDEILDAMR